MILTRPGVLVATVLLGVNVCTATGHCAEVEVKPDKIKHFFVSMALGAAAAGAARGRGATPCRAAGIGFGISLSFGLGKEAYDLRVKRSGWGWGDLFWDVIGATAGSMLTSGCR